MAEATDRPHAAEQAPSDAVMSGEQLSALSPPTEPYQALSLLALAGFGIAAVYSFIVLLGAAVALFGHFPWLMPYWTFLVPLAALVVCWAAATRIRNSEGTLSGLAFVTWGSRLAILVGLTYAAYYGFTFLAVRFQAVDCADRFFDLVKQGNLEEAFLKSQGVPTRGMDKNEMRDAVESRFNQPRGRPGAVGPFTRFRQDLFIRFLQLGGDKASITARGVDEWEYTKGGYKVILNYHIATTLVEFDAKVETLGLDPQPGEPKGRQWRINFGNSFTIISDSKKLTPQGEMFMVKVLMSQTFVTEWIAKINQSQWTDAYLDTLEPTERERLRKNPKAIQVDPRAALGKERIHIDDKLFWAGKQQREAMRQRFLDTFKLGVSGHSTFSMSLQQQGVPLAREDNGRTTFFFDIGLYYLDEAAGNMQYMAEGLLTVSAEDKAAEFKSGWRIDAINIDTGRTPPVPTMQRMQPPTITGKDGMAPRP